MRVCTLYLVCVFDCSVSETMLIIHARFENGHIF